MNQFDRRQFVFGAAATAAAATIRSRSLSAADAPPRRKMTINLSCGSIGVGAGQLEAIDLAARHGFESVDPDVGYLAKLSDGALADLTGKMKEKKLVFGAAGLGVEFRTEESQFAAGMKRLPVDAAAMRRAGLARVGTWLTPCHGTLTYLANFKQHARRLREVAKTLGDQGLRLGMEYVGPKTSWTGRRYPFIHTMAEMKELVAEIGTGNVGLVLDSWHWYTAGETEADLLSLTARDVVACDLNDAPAGIPVDQQVDSRRELPAATGVIDVKAFLAALARIGYDGPVRAEPFNAALRKLPKEEAVAAVSKAMHKAFALVG
ncbi:MAG: sugar phosphate isomerase/epimerase family protein [Pirellulales bacterium]